MAIEILTVERVDCPLDLLLFLRLRREVPGLVEATFDRNPGLAALGAFLPIGTRVEVAVPDAPVRAPARHLITLWT